MTLQVVTANRLDDGLAVFYHETTGWSALIEQASSVDNDKDAEQLLEKASSDENQLIVVGPYLIDVKETEGALQPVRYREMIRTLGPSVRPDLGYQAK